MYFNSIPKIFYDSEDTKNPKIVTNLLRRVGVRDKVKVNTALFDTYKVKEGESPEIIAHKLYGDTELHWVIMLVNNVLDRYHDWPMSTPQFNQYIADKYVDSDGESTASDVQHYEIEQDSGSDKIKIEVTDLTNYPTATTITNYEYEQTRQDKLREIRLLDPQYVQDFVREYRSLMNESSV